MSQLASDNFNRANESPLASPWVVSGFGLNLVSNKTEGSQAAANCTSFYDTSVAWPDDQYSQATIVGPFTDGRGLVVRWSGGDNGYLLVVDTGNNMAIYQVIGGGFLSLLTG